MNTSAHFQEGIKMIGEWDFYITPDGKPLTHEELATLREGGNIGRDVRKQHYKNLIPTVSRAQVAKALCGEIASKTEIQISHAELGTSTTAPANGDTGLITPTGATRKAIGSMASSSNIGNFTAFWAATEATGTWREFALFINGTGTSNSGTIFNRVAINVTVSSSDALTIDGTVTIT